jgi:hypothetical protein
MASPEFKADMEGFDVSNIIDVRNFSSTRPPLQRCPEYLLRLGPGDSYACPQSGRMHG